MVYSNGEVELLMLPKGPRPDLESVWATLRKRPVDSGPGNRGTNRAVMAAFLRPFAWPNNPR